MLQKLKLLAYTENYIKYFPPAQVIHPPAAHDNRSQEVTKK